MGKGKRFCKKKHFLGQLYRAVEVLASAIGVLLILLGAFVMDIGYQAISDCIKGIPGEPSAGCWNPAIRDNFGFYAGAAILGFGAILLVGPDLVRLLGRFRGEGANPQQ